MSIKPKNKKIISFSIFIGLVIIPWVFIIVYVLMMAHPRYVSTSNVVVKQVSEAQVPMGTGIAALLGANNTSVEDANYLTEFILSNDIVKKLDSRFHFRETYFIDGSDPIYEIDPNATQEELLEYFKSRVHIDLDEQTHILTVSTEGFNPKFALDLNQAILSESEQFVNAISQDIAQEQLKFAQDQLDEAKERLDESKQALLTYQNENQIFDPQINAQTINQLIGGLQVQLASLRTEERQLLSYLNPDAPQVVSIRSQISSVETQIEEEKAKLTSPSTTKLNRQAIQFESIKADVEFAAELYKIALSSLEKSRLEAFRKMKNLIVLSAPHEAQEARYPRQAYIVWVSLVLLLIFYGFVRLLMAVIRDHSN